jgi:predicted TIM-barrel fold metal-dependent hydrolase
MAFPGDIAVVDTMIWFPTPATVAAKVEYLFDDDLSLAPGRDPVAHTLEQMDRFGIERAVVDVDLDPVGADALAAHPDRFIGSCVVDPNQGMDAVRKIERLHRDLGIRAVSFSPMSLVPQVPIDDRRAYPVYAKCAELGIPVFITVGVPGPLVPMAAQKVELLDEVCCFFPELTIVMRHGGEPWSELAVMLMRKWPNLFYSTSAFAPKRYPSAVIEFANTRTGAGKVLFAGYYAVGLSWERVFAQLADVPLKDEVWPRFLRDNALHVLGLAEGS